MAFEIKGPGNADGKAWAVGWHGISQAIADTELLQQSNDGIC